MEWWWVWGIQSKCLVMLDTWPESVLDQCPPWIERHCSFAFSLWLTSLSSPLGWFFLFYYFFYPAGNSELLSNHFLIIFYLGILGVEFGTDGKLGLVKQQLGVPLVFRILAWSMLWDGQWCYEAFRCLPPDFIYRTFLLEIINFSSDFL